MASLSTLLNNDFMFVLVDMLLTFLSSFFFSFLSAKKRNVVKPRAVSFPDLLTDYLGSNSVAARI